MQPSQALASYAAIKEQRYHDTVVRYRKINKHIQKLQEHAHSLRDFNQALALSSYDPVDKILSKTIALSIKSVQAIFIVFSCYNLGKQALDYKRHQSIDTQKIKMASSHLLIALLMNLCTNDKEK